MKKKILSICVVLGLLFSMCACGTPSPTKTVDNFLAAVKSQDPETIKTIYAGEDFAFADVIDLESDEEEATALDKVLQEQLYPKLMEFEYTVSNEVIDGDKATVDVTITTYNFGSAFNAFLNAYLTQAFALIWSDVSDEELDKLGATLLTPELDKLTEMTTEKTATVSLTSTEEGWVIDEFEAEGEFYDALTGGIVSTMATFEDIYD